MATRLLLFSLFASIMISGCADENPVSDIFQAEGVVGTFVAASLSGDVVHSYNESRSIERFAPASTFKIANTLIALDLDEVQSELSTFAWDGEDRGVESWNHDQTLATAFKVSCVWCYQEIARGVGAERYELALGKLDYGNRTIGDRVDWFWLDGSLQISAIEQITFLRKLYNYDVPYRREHIDVLKKIMITQHTVRHTIYAKTGWAATDPQVAWYVGFVESGEDTWLFAMNMQVDSPEQAALREKISLRSLQALGII